MIRFTLALIAFTIVSSDVSACPGLFGRLRERHVVRERHVSTARPAAVRLFAPRVAAGGCANGVCSTPGVTTIGETGPATLGTRPLTLPLVPKK